jgi:putative flippase GtrA
MSALFKKLKELLIKHNDLIVYLILGVLTTLVNYAVYFPLHNLLSLSASVSNVFAWLVSVLFAFLTNKPLAFKSMDWSLKVTVPEFTKFVGCRVGSGLLETLFLMLTVDLLVWNGNIMKLIISVAVVLINYFASKFFVFRK